MAAAVFPGERHVVAAEHVERCPGRRDDAHEVDELAEPGRRKAKKGHALLGERLPQNLILGIEAAGPREAGDGPTGDKVGPLGDRHALAEPAHLAHVLLVVAPENDRARTEEQRRLEKRVGEQVVRAGPVRAHANADEHETKLRYRRVGQHLLDVVLEEADGCREQRGECADERHPTHGRG